MPQLLTTNATILCPHGGVGVSVPGAPLWSIRNGFVLVDGDTGTLPTCPLLLFPCVGYVLRSMKLNATTIAGRQAMLATDFNQTLTGLPLSIVEHHTTIDDSTPAPIPPGGPAPALPPALADPTTPEVTVSPPAASFSLTSQIPPTIGVAFALTAAFPLQWVLTRVSEPLDGSQGSGENLTGGKPPGAVVTPAGGEWKDPSLQVALALTVPYLSQLVPGRHHFFMTGVNRRGRSSHAEFILTVTP